MIPLSEPHTTGEEITLLDRVIQNNEICIGRNISFFELEISKQLGGRHTLVTSSGTAALHLALLVLGVGPGDTVLCSTLTFVGGAAPILYTGATPVFVDSDLETWCMDPNLLGPAIEAYKPAAVVITDIYGQPANPLLYDICARYGVPSISDSAESFGSIPYSCADISIISFNGNKIITTGGGGAITSNDGSHIAEAKWLANQAKNGGGYTHSEIGYNYRMSNITASVGLAQIRHLRERVSRRRWVNQKYKASVPYPFMPDAIYAYPNNWLSVMLHPNPSALIEHLGMNNIESRRAWKPMHTQPLFADCECVGGEVAEGIYSRGVCLPSSSTLTEPDIEYVIKTIRSEP